MELTANIMNADLKDSRDKMYVFEPDMKTKEELIVKQEDESQEEEEYEVNATDISRHAMVSDLELNELEDSRNEISKLTMKQTTWAVNCFTGWLEAQGLQVDLTTVEKTELNGVLRHFYGSVRNGKGELYGIASYIALRAGLNRYLKEPPFRRSVCLMRDAEFTSANKVFLGVLKRIRKCGRNLRSHHQALSSSDIRILRHSRAMDTSTPRGLLNKVWFDVQVHFGRRGKQANRNLKPDSFVIRKDERGRRCCALSFGDETKIHIEKDRGSMFEKPGSAFCPITSLLKYLSKLPCNATALYVQPKKDLTDEIWYSHTPLGVNYLGSMLSRMCKEAGTSIIYTNHCIRSTPFHLLCDPRLEARETIPVGMNRTESSLQSPQTPSLGGRKLRKILPKSDSAGPAGLDLNHEEFLEDFPFLQNASNQNYVPDAVLPPGEPWLHGGPSRAVLSLPSCLCLCGDVGSGMSGPGSSGEDQMGEMKVYAKCHLQKGVMFGPFLGEVCRGQMPSNLKYAWAIRDDAAFVYVDASDESKSNWMRYVTYTSSEEEHNLVIFQFYRHIYYRVSQPITEGTELRVWIGKDYATLLGLGMGDNVKCEVGDKETVLRLLQDIQLVTLPEPSSSSLWSDNSQSQSPMLVISDVTTVSNPDAASDSGMMSASAFPSSSSLISLPSPGSHSLEKYDFMPGTEKLLSNPNVTENSPWYFFGFEPDPTGRPLDRSAVVCKLCGEHISCGGGAADLQIHLTNKHHIRTRDGNKDRSLLTIGQQRSQPVMLNSSLVSTPPLVLSSNVTNAIANFLIVDLQPPALVEGDGFKQLIHTLLPSYKELPSPRQLDNLLREHHNRGKASLAQLLLLRRKPGSGENEEVSDYTAPIGFESRRRGRPLGYRREVPHFVTLSVDVWFHSWQGSTERYLTLWAHYIDCHFNFQNLALATQRLTKSGGKDCSLRAVEAQVKGMAQEWGISQPNLVLLGGEGRNKMRPGQIKSKRGGEAGGSAPHPNSTTFLEREDPVSPEEAQGLEHGSHSSEGLPSVPCFFSAVQGCIEEVMSHSVISKTLSQFQGILTNLFLPPAHNKGSYAYHGQSLLHTLTKQEQAELKSWAHSRPTWNKLYPLLSVLIKHKSLFCDMIKEVKGEGSSKEDTGSESSSSGSCHANSTSNTSSTSVATLRSEWKVLEELCLVLKPLDVACRTLAKEAFPRLSLVKPILTGLLSRHLMSRPGDSSSTLKEVKRMMRRNLASCYENPVVNRVLCVACSLDPQFHGLGFMEDKEQTATFDWLKQEAVRIVKEDRRRSQGKTQSQIKRSPSPGSPESESDFLRRSKRLKESRPINFRELIDVDEDDESDPGEADDCEFVDPGSQGGLSGMEFLLGDLFSSAPKGRQSSVEESIDMEMSVFRADKGASLGVEPLQWWRTKAVQFPLLAAAARAYLAAPAVAGSAAQDFVQEGAGAAYRKRANIPPESLDSILFLHHNHMPDTESGQTAVRNEDRNSGIEKVP